MRLKTSAHGAARMVLHITMLQQIVQTSEMLMHSTNGKPYIKIEYAPNVSSPDITTKNVRPLKDARPVAVFITKLYIVVPKR